MAALLSDENIILRAPEHSDISSFMIWENDTSAWRDSSTLAPMSRRQLWDYIENYDGDIFAARQLRLIIEEKATGDVVGAVDLFDFDPINNHCQLGLYISRDFRGKGYAKSAVVLIQSYAFRFLHIHQLMVIVGEDNAHSVAIFKELNYDMVALLPHRLRRSDGYIAAYLFTKINPE